MLLLALIACHRPGGQGGGDPIAPLQADDVGVRCEIASPVLAKGPEPVHSSPFLPTSNGWMKR